MFNIIDVDKTIKANGLCNTKRVHDGTDNEETLGDLVEDLVYFLTELDNIYGVQQHPEKSHDAGIKVLQNFWRV